MTDVARCLLLPDASPPSDGALKNLALYWDQIVVQDGAYRRRPIVRAEELGSVPDRSNEAKAFEAAGVVVRTPDDIPAESLFERGRMAADEPGGIDLLAIERDADGRTRFTGLLKITEETLGPPNEPSSISDRELVEALSTLTAESLIARAGLGRELAAKNNLAPVAPSLVSHLAALATDDDDYPFAEAAMISAAVQAFVVMKDTPVETVLAFRERNVHTMQRFRGAMIDLAEGLRHSDVHPAATLDAARDIYRTRVEPSLAALEDRLNESNLKFAIRSVVGAAALAISPIAPTSAIESGIRLGAQTIKYRFSRQQLLDEHPYAYLHRLGDADFLVPREHLTTDLISGSKDPKQTVVEYFDKEFERAFWLRRRLDELRSQ
jgi:hypothetical protein